MNDFSSKVADAKIPKVSVCVSTYKQEDILSDCLESIIEQETDFPIEIIVSDDCSPDGTANVIRDYEKRYPGLVRGLYHSSNRGAGENLMAVHEVATGEYVAHIDGDDMMMPGKLQKQADFLDQNPGYAVVWHRVCKLDDDGNRRFPRDRPNDYNASFSLEDVLTLGTIATHSSKMYRRKYHTMYRARAKYKFDFEFDLLQLGHGKGYVLDNILGIYRIGANQATSVPDNGWRRIRQDLLIERVQSKGRGYRNASALLLYTALSDVIRRREYSKDSVMDFIRGFSPFSFLIALIYLPRKSSIRVDRNF